MVMMNKPETGNLKPEGRVASRSLSGFWFLVSGLFRWR